MIKQVEINISNVQQGSDEWLDLRHGKFTASTFHPLMTMKEDKLTDGQRTLIYNVAYERLITRSNEDDYQSPAMIRGTMLEPEAKTAYEIEKGCYVHTVGFVEPNEKNPFYGYVGSSPDGLVGDDGLIEIKCPVGANYLKAVDSPINPAHHTQMQLNMLLLDREWCDYVLYNPDLPMPINIRRVDADPAKLDRINEVLDLVIDEVDAIISTQEFAHLMNF